MAGNSDSLVSKLLSLYCVCYFLIFVLSSLSIRCSSVQVNELVAAVPMALCDFASWLCHPAGPKNGSGFLQLSQNCPPSLDGCLYKKENARRLRIQGRGGNASSCLGAQKVSLFGRHKKVEARGNSKVSDKIGTKVG